MIKLNSVQIKPTRFPDNTSQVWKIDEKLFKERSIVTWEFLHEAELIHLAQLKTLLDSSGVRFVRLYIDYLPYARQDKDVSNDNTFALRVFAKLLNSLKFNEVIINDPHSSVALDLIDNSCAVYPTSIIEELLSKLDIDMICYPDNGAFSKYTKVYKLNEIEIIRGNKIRDQSTGRITNYEVIGSGVPLTDKNILIIDDICDYGNTFIYLTTELKKHNPKSISLFITYGLFSGGLSPLLNVGINKIFTNKGEAIKMKDNLVGFKLYNNGK